MLFNELGKYSVFFFYLHKEGMLRQSYSETQLGLIHTLDVNVNVNVKVPHLSFVDDAQDICSVCDVNIRSNFANHTSKLKQVCIEYVIYKQTME